MTLKRYRNLNPGECYACGEKPLRRQFGDTDIDISIGSLRDYSPDISIPKRLVPKGLIVAALLVNHRRSKYGAMQPLSNGLLSLYVIRDQAWTEAQSDEFISSALPRLHEWYLRNRSASAVIGGCDWMLVEWNGKDLLFHELHSA